METRRRSLEVAKARKDQAAEKYIKIRDEINLKKKAGSWMEKASYELMTLHKIHGKNIENNYFYLQNVYYSYIIIMV